MDAYLGEIKIFPLTYAPTGWLPCDGRSMRITGNQALYALLGTYYGGDGRNTFNLPDLRGRVPIQMISSSTIGANGGSETVSLTRGQMNPHTHLVAAVDSPGKNANGLSAFVSKSVTTTGEAMNLFSNVPLTTANTVPLNPAMINSVGGNSGHNNMQPFQVVGYCIAVSGIFPPRS